MQLIIESLIKGLPVGCVYALVAVGIVLTYKVSGVFNLAFGAQAFVSAAFYYELRVKHGWPIPPAAIIAVLVVSPALGLLLYFSIFQFLRTAAPVARLAVSIGLLLALPEIVKIVLGWGSSPQFGVDGIMGHGSVTYKIFGSFADRNQLATIVFTVVAVAALTLMFRYTTIGLRMRAVVESARMTELAGVSSNRVSSFGWALSSIFAGLAGILLGPLFPQLSSQNFIVVMVAAVAAAAFAGLTSIPLALVGGIGLGFAGQILSRKLPTNSILAQNLRPSLPFIALFLVLILKPSLQRKREFVDPLAGVDPPPPARASDERGRGLTIATYTFGAFVGAIALWYFAFAASAFWLLLATDAIIYSIIFLSITVFTGMAGQISLAQGAFAAIGAITCGQLAHNHNVPVLIGMIAGIAIASAVGALLAIPALRLGGIYLALATLAFALFFENVIVTQSWAAGGLINIDVPRPSLLAIDFNNDRTFMFLCVILLAVAGLIVIRVRGGTTGRNLRALSGSEVAASSIGINPARARITAFALSAGLAAAGGALLAMRDGAIGMPYYQADFAVFFGLFWLVLVVTLGARTVEGAIQAAVGLKFFPQILKFLGLVGAWQYVFFGLGAITFARHPEGILEFNKRQSLNRIQGWIDRYQGRGKAGEVPARDDGAETSDGPQPAAVAVAAEQGG